MLCGERDTRACCSHAADDDVCAVCAVGDKAKQTGGRRVQFAAENLTNGNHGRGSVGEPAVHASVA
jgi:hypothetical protein